jgi:hypothetical protein
LDKKVCGNSEYHRINRCKESHNLMSSLLKLPHPSLFSVSQKAGLYFPKKKKNDQEIGMFADGEVTGGTFFIKDDISLWASLKFILLWVSSFPLKNIVRAELEFLNNLWGLGTEEE